MKIYSVMIRRQTETECTTVIEHYVASHILKLIKKLELELQDASSEVIQIRCEAPVVEVLN